VKKAEVMKVHCEVDDVKLHNEDLGDALTLTCHIELQMPERLTLKPVVPQNQRILLRFLSEISTDVSAHVLLIRRVRLVGDNRCRAHRTGLC